MYSDELGCKELDGLTRAQLQSRVSVQDALLAAAVDGIVAIDARGHVRQFNRAAEVLFGYAAAEVLGNNVSMLMPQPHAALHDSYLQAYAGGGKAGIVGIGRDVEGRRKNGEVFPMHLSVGVAETEEGRLFVGICHDLTSYKQALLNLHHAEKRYRDIVESQTELIMRVDAQLRLTFCNPAMVLFLGESAEAMLGKSLLEFIHPDDRVIVKRQFEALFSEGLHQQLQIRMRCGGSERWIDWRVRALGTPLQLKEGWEFQGLGLDITEHVQAREQAEYLATHDPLTGLHNRASFVEGLRLLLSNRRHEGRRSALLHINLDRFKLANEALGQLAGDQILKMSAGRIRASLSRHDLLARLGADQFAVLVDDIGSAKQAAALAQRILARLSESYATAAGPFNLTASLGVCLCPDDGRNHEQLLRKAEAAMHEAKAKGRNELVFFSEQLQEQLRSALELELGIRQALAGDAFELYFQPKYRLDDGRLQGMEVLLRWFHPEWGAVSPARFIPFAEKHGLARGIGDWVLRQTCAQIRLWQAQGLTVPRLAVNLSAQHFECRDLHGQLRAILAEYGVRPAQLELEITEGTALGNTGAHLALLRQLRAEGFGLAIDDFGTGYSSLSYLTRLPATSLKIDRAFVSRIKADTRHDPVVEAVIVLGHSLGMEVVAEGVENAAQAEFLRSKGCDLVQGFHFSRPLNVAACTALLVEQAPR